MTKLAKTGSSVSDPVTIVGVNLPLPPVWASQAACTIAAEPDIFFPIQGGSSKAARAICATCPVRVPCLTWALSNNEELGIWGGTSDRDRRVLRQHKAKVERERARQHQKSA